MNPQPERIEPEPADFPELRMLAQRVLNTPTSYLHTLPDPVLAEALESLLLVRRWHELHFEGCDLAVKRLLDARQRQDDRDPAP